MMNILVLNLNLTNVEQVYDFTFDYHYLFYIVIFN